jgi:membrane protein DedA with SNARE-associated domain
MTMAMLTHFVGSYGYLAVILFVGLESVGIPLPGESTLIAAALYAGATHHLNIVAIGLVATAAAIAGDNLGYVLGRTGGQRLVKRYGRYVHLTESRLAVGRYLFRRRGGSVVFFGRFIALLRTFAAFLAGMNRMPWRRFLAWNAAGGALWAGLVSFGAYLLGNTAANVGTMVTVVGIALTVPLTIVTVVLTRRSFAKLAARAAAEEATPAWTADGEGADKVPTATTAESLS